MSFSLQSDNLILVSHCTATIGVNVFVCKILGKYNQISEGSLFLEKQTYAGIKYILWELYMKKNFFFFFLMTQLNV